MSDIGIMSGIPLYFKGFALIIMSVIITMRGITVCFMQKKEPAYISCGSYKKRRSPIIFKRNRHKIKRFESVYKPSSVVYGHLSRLAVADKLKRYLRYSVGRTALLTDTQSCSEWGLHGTHCYQRVGELLPRLSILTVMGNP